MGALTSTLSKPSRHTLSLNCKMNSISEQFNLKFIFISLSSNCIHVAFIHSKKPCWDVPREGLQHETIENERNYHEMFNQQDMYKKKAEIQRKVNQKRIEDMQQTQLNLKEKFINVNQFMKECMDKTKRSEEQIDTQLESQKTLKTQIEAIERDLVELSVFETKFKEIVKEFQPYEDVFKEAIESSEYTSFEDLMSRCDSLSKLNQ
jgi:hypothetical protein